MARPPLLNETQINKELNKLQLWELDSRTIKRELVGENFISVIGMVNAIAIIAEKMDHHPDLLIYGWNKLRITLTTHDQGGLTELDFKFAQELENLNY